ncbi:hypothetical protein ACWD4L_48910, partial [Streptomyces sp. NPDC002596]
SGPHGACREWSNASKAWNSSSQDRGFIGAPHSAQGSMPSPWSSKRAYAGFEITEDGIAHLVEHHAAYAAAYPDLSLPHPSAPVTWPEEADQLLTRLHDGCWALSRAAHETAEGAEKARARAKAALPKWVYGKEETLVLDMHREVHQLKTEQAQALTDEYERQRERLQAALCERVGQYTAAGLAAVTALVEGADPAAAIRTQISTPAAELPEFTPTGLPVVDVEGHRLHPPTPSRHRPQGASEGHHRNVGRLTAPDTARHRP